MRSSLNRASRSTVHTVVRGETGTRFAPSQKSDKKGIFSKFRNPNSDHIQIFIHTKRRHLIRGNEDIHAAPHMCSHMWIGHRHVLLHTGDRVFVRPLMYGFPPW